MQRNGDRPGSGVGTPNIDRSIACAKEVIDKLGLSKLPIAPRLISKNLGIPVSDIALDGPDGCLMRVGNRAKIIVNSSITVEGRKNFTIAHELGHWHLHPYIDQSWICTVEDIGGYQGSAPELEANAFAAELLMPTTVLKEKLKYASPTMQKSVEIAESCGTALTAAAIRLVELIDVPAITVLSSSNRVVWTSKNDRSRERYILRGQEVGDDALAWNCTTDVDDVEEPQEVDAKSWFPEDHRLDRLEVFEQSVALGSFNVVLSMLSVYEL